MDHYCVAAVRQRGRYHGPVWAVCACGESFDGVWSFHQILMHIEDPTADARRIR